MTVEIYCGPNSDSSIKLVRVRVRTHSECQTHSEPTIRLPIGSLASYQTHPSCSHSTPKSCWLLQSSILMEACSLSKHARLWIYPALVWCVFFFFFLIKHAWQLAFKVSTMCVWDMHKSWNPDSLYPLEETLPHWCQCWQSSYSNLKAYKGFQS